MTKEQETQQAQTIANEIESAKIAGNNKRVIDLLEEIVDSQAQKIAEQAKEIEKRKPVIYTKDDFREKFTAFQHAAGDFDLTRNDDGSYDSIHTQIAWISWVEAARFLGALKG